MKNLLAHPERKTDSFAVGPVRQGMAEYFATEHHDGARGIRQLRPNVVKVKVGSSMRAGAE
jgi:hypothetical protein